MAVCKRVTKVAPKHVRVKMESPKVARAKRDRYMKLYKARNLINSETKTFLGKGAFGSVFLVQREPSEFHILPAEYAVKTAKVADSFTLRYEKQLLTQLSSCEYVVGCYGDGTEEDDWSGERMYHLYLQFCSGGSLKNHLFIKGLLPEQVKSYTRDILRGLAYIHKEGIVHCDIKPDNILLVPRTGGGFRAKLADFGLAKNKLLEVQENPHIGGTTRYLSPERVADGVIWYSADIWALGCTVLEMMCGALLWGQSMDKETLLYLIGSSTSLPEIPIFASEDAKDFLKLCFDRNYLTRKSAEELLNHPFVSEDN